MTPQQFIAKWQDTELSERSACQQHFLDLCDLLHQAKPAEVDKDGSYYTFERGVSKNDGGKGWADVWLKGKFGWEYKGKHKDLKAAYKQLLLYRESLENPPLLVVCDLDRFIVHTNFTGTIKQEIEFDLQGLNDPKNLQVLRNVFTNPEALKPGQTPESITQKVAERFAELSDGMQKRGIEPFKAAHFLMKLMFCMFSEDIELLPKDLFTKTVANSKSDPIKLSKLLRSLFEAMEKGGTFGPEIIEWFNGGLFSDSDVIDLTPAEIKELLGAAHANWANVEPTIFGTLFERTLDPDKRSQIGAHYTSRADIETLLNPVMMDPLRREWADVKEKAEKLYAKVTAGGSRARSAARSARQAFEKCLEDFRDRLAHVQVLDPACGSGNFLYVAINLLLNLEKEVITYASTHDLSLHPLVRPTQLHGLEINTYAAELAQVVIWIGFLQWMHFNGFVLPRDPVLQNVNSIVQGDAIIDLSDPANPKEPEWPEAEFIVGNPPFLGNKMMRSGLGDVYVTALWTHYGDRLPAMSDLVTYWFEKARATIESGRAKRAGLLATTGVKQVGGRRALERICATGRIFFAESDRDWINEGAAVRIVMAGFENKEGRSPPILDGKEVNQINADLSGGIDLTVAKSLAENENRCFMGTTKIGAFDIEFDAALEMLSDPNPHVKPNSDLLRPFRNGSDLVQNCSDRWIVDCGVGTNKETASLYSAPFEYLVSDVKPDREKNARASRAEKWWLLGETLPAFRAAIANSARYIATARVAKHRLFVWLDSVVLPDSKVIAIAFDNDFHFGVLHSRVHESWSLAKCGWHGKGNDATYNPNTCFLTFPFPHPTKPQEAAIVAAAKELDSLRNNWLNPPEWTKTETLEFPGSMDGPWKRYIDPASVTSLSPQRQQGTEAQTLAGAAGSKSEIGTVHYPRLVAKDASCADKLKKRTLTNLYNESPTWLKNVHAKLNEAVFAAYGWDAAISDDELLAKLLALNLERAGSSQK